ncbi:Transcription factor, fungi [Penicillium camemberti]|uniref:Transcription factor, fungi n=1 Tax=Penicillium camemberti (strain FM 013) TaxID=1429867 RepID=A0A0G4P6B1_PENC3|nr:Transcription factor, fungi [Penicillium camemberti]
MSKHVGGVNQCVFESLIDKIQIPPSDSSSARYASRFFCERTGRPDVSDSTALGEDRSFHESDLFVENLEVAVAPDGYPINCDIQPSTAHAETLLSQHLGSNDLDMGLLNELLSFDQSVDSFEFLTDMVENDAASPFSIDQNSVDSSPGRTMDLVYYLEDNCNADIPTAVGRSCGIIHPNTRDADASQDHWPTKYAAQRYLRAFFDSFHRHIPLLHIPTYLERQPPGPLQLAVYAIGALHAFNQVAACDLYHAGHEKLLKETSTLPALERMQALLLLTMFASWSDDDSLRAESIPLQSQLAAELRGCPIDVTSSESSSWGVWVERESFKRTILNIMCFLGVMNVALLSSTVFLPPNFDIELPYSEELWVCNNREEWERLFSSAPRPQTFTVAFHNLTSLSGSILHNDCGLTYLVLMVALYNHVKSCRGLASSLPVSLGQEIVNTNISSLNRWLLSLTESKILRPQQHIFADSSLAASALILWKTTMLLLHADPASVADVQDAILTLSLGHDKAVPPWNPAHKTCNVAPAMGHAVSFIQAPVVRGVQFLQATACMSISIYHGLLGFHSLILLVRWISSLESSNEQIDEQSIHSDELLLLRDIRVLITESDLPSLDRLPLSAACARIWAETLQSDRQIWGIRTVLHTYLQKLI